ncbi:MAG: glycoside hydrolase family 3 C-terminal domain-containing protein [Reichenbachiella sp.]
MKKILKFTGLGILALLVLSLLGLAGLFISISFQSSNNMALLGTAAPTLEKNGIEFRDLNKNGKLDTYENSAAALDDRVDDLVAQMTLDEKTGTMFIAMIGMTAEGGAMEKPIIDEGMLTLMMSVIFPSNSNMIAVRKMNSFNILASHSADILATYNNTIQNMAERTRLGIPVTIATDPRHVTENNPGAAVYTPSFSSWPSSLGLAATRDTLLVREFGDIARQEYNAVGIKLALHPMADLATEPRWGRTNGTFGEDAELSAMMTNAYVLGFQGDSLDANSVACMTKHFSGGGPQADGEDPHFPYGKEQAYPGNNFDYHVIPFVKGAFKANTAQIMPYYGIPMEQTDENVAFAFNKSIITKLLRDSLGFNGVVCTDWAIINDSKFGAARAWGVEDLTPSQRVKKVIDAGCDQFGGENSPELISELVTSGQLSEARIDISVKRIMRDKFILGLFDNPYVDVAAANRIAGNDAFNLKGKEAQKKSTILLKNDGILPLKKGTKVYAEGMLHPELINKYGQLVDNPADADVIFKRLQTPFDVRDDYFLESFFHQGRLYFSDEERADILGLINQKPSIVSILLERPAIITEINDATQAMMADFGTDDESYVEILFGQYAPSAKLPFELPSSWEAVLKQKEDVPYDSENPLYPFGYGMDGY